MFQIGRTPNFRGACVRSSVTIILKWRKNNACGTLKISLAGIRMMKTTKRFYLRIKQCVLDSVAAEAKCTLFSLVHRIEIVVQPRYPLFRAIQLMPELHCYRSDQLDNSHFDERSTNPPTMTLMMKLSVFVEAVMMAESWFNVTDAIPGTTYNALVFEVSQNWARKKILGFVAVVPKHPLQISCRHSSRRLCQLKRS
jgi:hypothetical protein